MLIKNLVCYIAASLSFAAYASALSVSQTSEDEGHLIQQNSSSFERIDITANELYLGQDVAVESFGLQIRLGEKDDMIYPNLLWHYRMGVRQFEILHQGLSESQAKKIEMFHERMKDICLLNEIMIQSEAEFSSTLPSSLKWILQLTDRQILCLHKPLAEILSEHRASTLSLPSCTYSGLNPEASVSFWPQTDEHLIYRSNIDYGQPVTLLNGASSGDVERSSAAHIATYATMEDAVPFTGEMILDQLPFMEVIRLSIQHACLGNEEYWEDENSVFPILETVAEINLNTKTAEFGFNDSIRFGKGYVYVTTPKCGCTTIGRAVNSYEANRVLNFASYRGFHKSPSAIAERFQYLLDDKIFKFTCVRNPYHRALSAFLNKIAWTSDENWFKEHLGFRPQDSISFIDFLRSVKNKSLREINEHFKPQWCLTMYPFVNYNKIIHLENFDEEFQEVITHLDIPGHPSDYTFADYATKASSRLSDYYTQECIDEVLEIYGKDFDYFGYSRIPEFTLLDKG